MDEWVDGKAGLRIAYNNKKLDKEVVAKYSKRLKTGRTNKENSDIGTFLAS